MVENANEAWARGETSSATKSHIQSADCRSAHTSAKSTPENTLIRP